ncbi:putative ribonuclease H protein, partial [Tanacetum coccineum]
ANRKHDGKHHPHSFSSFLHEGSSRRKVNFCTLEWEKKDLADVLIPVSLVLEVQERFENMVYGYFLGKKVVFSVVERKLNSSFKLSKEELTFVPVWIKFHGVPASKFTTDGLSLIATHLGTPIMLDLYSVITCVPSWGRMDYVRTLVDIRDHQALKDTMVISVPNPMQTWDGSNHSLPKQQVPKSAYQTKTNSTPVSNSFSNIEEDNGKKGEYSLESGFTSLNQFDLFTKDDEMSMLRGLHVSDDDRDEDDGSDETTHSYKSLSNSIGDNT